MYFCVHFPGAKMHFCKGKCSASHFTVSNVTNLFGAAVFSRSENKGSAKMYFCKAKRTFVTFSKGKCKAKSNVQHSILATQRSKNLGFYFFIDGYAVFLT